MPPLNGYSSTIGLTLQKSAWYAHAFAKQSDRTRPRRTTVGRQDKVPRLTNGATKIGCNARKGGGSGSCAIDTVAAPLGSSWIYQRSFTGAPA